jgi:hypothetical protein
MQEKDKQGQSDIGKQGGQGAPDKSDEFGKQGGSQPGVDKDKIPGGTER